MTGTRASGPAHPGQVDCGDGAQIRPGKPGRDVAMSRQAPIPVLLCGERLRGDDGAAALAACLLPPDVVALATISEPGELSPDALLAISPATPLVVADAAVGIPAGAVVVLDLEALADAEADGAIPASSHAFPAQEVLALVAEIRGSPVRGSFVGIGAATFGFGEPLSARVAEALPGFAAAIAAEIRRLALDEAGGPVSLANLCRKGPLEP
jgi:hydrogenase maturation protease